MDNLIENVPPLCEGWEINYYRHDYRCDNCKKINERLIKKGNSIKGTKIECHNCGCGIKGQ